MKSRQGHPNNNQLLKLWRIKTEISPEARRCLQKEQAAAIKQRTVIQRKNFVISAGQ